MPRLGETMEEGTLQKWLVQPGQPYKRGETIAEIETDKTVVEFPALEDGRILAYLAQEGEVVAVGNRLAELEGGEGEDGIAGGREREASDQEPAATISSSVISLRKAPSSCVLDEKIAASPAARRLAQRSSLDLASLTGSGRRGRVQQEDVLKALDKDGVGDTEVGDTAVESGMDDDHRLYAKELGPASAETIVFLHGFAGDADAWVNIQLPLSRGMHTIAFDLPGHARSLEHPGIGGVSAMAQAVKEALEQRQLGRVHLVGHSMGGAVALSLALQDRSRIKSLTLLAPAGLSTDVNHRLLRRFAKTRSHEVISIILEQLIGWRSRLPRNLADLIVEQRSDPRITEKLEEILETLVVGDKQKVLPLDEVNALPIPIRLIWGSRDSTVPIEQAEALWSASLYRFEGIGHLPHMEIPQEVIALIRQACCKPMQD